MYCGFRDAGAKSAIRRYRPSLSTYVELVERDTRATDQCRQSRSGNPAVIVLASGGPQDQESGERERADDHPGEQRTQAEPGDSPSR